MILRRISRHLKEQNWTAIVLDFFIVVIGVYVGIQADNWNELRKETGLEKDYLQRLSQDIQNTIRNNEDQIAFMLSHGYRASVVLDSLKKCEIAEKDRIDFVNGLYHPGKVYHVPMVRTTIDELTATGRMYTINREDIKSQLETTIAEYESTAGLGIQIFNRLAPPVAYVDSQVVYRVEKPQLGGVELGWDDIEMNFERLCEDEHFYTAVGTARNYTFDVIAQNQRVLAEIKKLGSLLDEALNQQLENSGEINHG